MSSTREKLMKLLCTVSCESELEGELGSCPYRKGGKCAKVERLDYCAMQKLADHLLANGVTFDVPDTNVGKWIPVSERLPGSRKGELYFEDDFFLVVFTGNIRHHDCEDFVFTAEYCGNGAWEDAITGADITDGVTHWMPLPVAAGG